VLSWSDTSAGTSTGTAAGTHAKPAADLNGGIPDVTAGQAGLVNAAPSREHA
jgi:hypothetical protein